LTTHQRQFARTLRRQRTSAEDVLWQALRGRRLAGLKFRRQVPLLTYTLDFVCVERRLVVELDGSGHERTKAYDDRRTREIEAYGLEVVRFTNDRVLQDIDAVLAVIAAAAGERASPRDPSPPTPLPSGRGEE
jgi:very-short-patch-repair endonuclease